MNPLWKNGYLKPFFKNVKACWSFSRDSMVGTEMPIQFEIFSPWEFLVILALFDPVICVLYIYVFLLIWGR